MKYYVKKKNFTKLVKDINDLKRDLEQGNFSGALLTVLIDKTQIRKIRLANTTINVGKSNGFRVVYCVDKVQKNIVMMTIYYKKETDMTDIEIVKLVESYFCNANT